jgi:3-phenylpropionate/trans-cinnamate dioxygenase ferredoxin component
MSSIKVASYSALAPSSVTRVVVDGNPVALVRIQDDLYAIGDTCSHADVSLSGGTVWEDECELECPKHGTAFSLKTGEPQSFPATKSVPVYNVSVDGDDVLITVEVVE